VAGGLRQAIWPGKLISFPFAYGEFAESGEDIASLPTPLRHSRAKALVALALEPARGFFLPAATAFVSSQRKTGKVLC